MGLYPNSNEQIIAQEIQGSKYSTLKKGGKLLSVLNKSQLQTSFGRDVQKTQPA
jgi:hypothetical protein